MSQPVFLVMGSHLFSANFLPAPEQTKILMIEDHGLCTHFRYHKHKLVLFLESMRNHADLLREKGYDVTYLELDQRSKNLDFEDKLKTQLKKLKATALESFEIEDRFFRTRLDQLTDSLRLDWVIYDSPLFLHTGEEFQELLNSSKRPRLRAFYERERKERDILMTRDGPIGGQFSFDQDNRKPLPKGTSVPSLGEPKASSHHAAVCQIVEKMFADHPGSTDNFWLPTTRSSALAWLRKFLVERLSTFGPYEDAISSQEPFVFHSVLSPLINIGLLTPEEVLEKALEVEDVPINSIEGFVRQVLGWREFIRGIDECFGEQQEQTNFFKHKRSLGEAWWTGETGIEPVDHSIRQLNELGYCHHIERLMVLSNMMLLCEIDPQEVYSWFMEMFVDSADWVMGPNVYGMGQFSDGGLFATKPYICGSNYLLKMSDFSRGPWCDIVDGLYWRFIDKHRAFFSKQPRLKMMVATFDRMAADKRKRLSRAAEAFLDEHTRKR